MKLLGLLVGVWIAPALLVLMAIGWSVLRKKRPIDVGPEQEGGDQGGNLKDLDGQAPDHVKSVSKR